MSDSSCRGPRGHRSRAGTRALAPVVALLATCLALAGCGLGPGTAPGGAQLTVTRDFGAHTLLELTNPRIVGADTVMRVLQRNASVTTRYGGGFVQSIDGVTGGHVGGRPVDWFYYVNGIVAPAGAAATRVNPGDRIWWDHHDWGAAIFVPAVVGSFPEPFVHGSAGKRLPVRVECADPGGDACRAVSDKLISLGVPAAQGSVGLGGGNETLTVIVGRWSALRADPLARQIEGGPQASGVYARFDASGSALSVLDQRGRTVRTLRAATGLVAATTFTNQKPSWFVTGTDDAGVMAATRAFDASALHDHFALAIADNIGVPLPQVTR